MIIKEMTLDDYEEVVQLWHASEGVSVRKADSKEGIERYLARNPKSSFVARDGDKLIGCVICGHDGRRGYLHHMAVDLKYRKKGLGKKLFQKCLDALSAQGIEKTLLFVHAENNSAQKFWEKVGCEWRSDLKMYSFISSDSVNA